MLALVPQFVLGLGNRCGRCNGATGRATDPIEDTALAQSWNRWLSFLIADITRWSLPQSCVYMKLLSAPQPPKMELVAQQQ